MKGKLLLTAIIIGLITASCDADFWADFWADPEPETEHTHLWGAWAQTTPPTCTEAGIETRTCSGDPLDIHTETRTGKPALGHDEGIWVTIGALKELRCTRCGYMLDTQQSVTPETTTAWNVLTLFFMNLDAPGYAPYSLTSGDADNVKIVIDMIPGSIESISGGLMTINQIDFKVITDPISVLHTSPYIYTNHQGISHILDEQLAGGNYHHVILVTPLSELAEGWIGLGGMVYQGLGVSEIHHARNKYIGAWWATPPFQDAVFIHEILHTLERVSKSIQPNTADLHSNADYGFTNGDDEWRAWYTAYMRNTLPDGNGLDPRAYEVPLK